MVCYYVCFTLDGNQENEGDETILEDLTFKHKVQGIHMAIGILAHKITGNEKGDSNILRVQSLLETFVCTKIIHSAASCFCH